MKRLTESQIQIAFFDYVRIRRQESKDSPWWNVSATPNEAGHNNFAQINRFKKEGLSKGFPDISVLIPTKKYPSYYIELKRKGGKPSENQKEWIERLSRWGFKAEFIITDDPEDLIKAVRIYLGEIKP